MEKYKIKKGQTKLGEIKNCIKRTTLLKKQFPSGGIILHEVKILKWRRRQVPSNSTVLSYIPPLLEQAQSLIILL